jgi:hypothetical protein
MPSEVYQTSTSSHKLHGVLLDLHPCSQLMLLASDWRVAIMQRHRLLLLEEHGCALLLEAPALRFQESNWSV